MPTPSAVQVATNENYVSTLDVAKPEIDDAYFEQHIDELLLLDFMEMLKQTKPVKATTYKHYERPSIMNYVTVYADVVAAGPGTPVTFRLSADNHVDGGKYSFPRLNDIAHFPNYTSGVVTAKSTVTNGQHTITITPHGEFEDIGALTAGQTVTIVSNVHAPGTGSPLGRTWSPLTYTNTCQIMKEAFTVEGSEMTNQTWVEIKNEETGETGFLWYYEGEGNTFRMMRIQQELNMIITPEITNPLLLNARYRTSEAMIPFIENRGGVVQNYNQGQFTLALHKGIIKRLDKKGTYANNYAFIQGIDLNDEYETFLADLGKYNPNSINYSGFGKDGKDVAVSLGFNSIYTLGYNFHIKRYRMFNHENCLGAPGMQYPGMGICMPMGTTVHAQTGKQVPYFRYRNKEAKGYNRGMEHWYTGGAGDIRKTDDIDVMKMHYRSEGSVEFFCPNQWVLVKRLA